MILVWIRVLYRSVYCTCCLKCMRQQIKNKNGDDRMTQAMTCV